MSLLAQEEDIPPGTVPIASLKLGESPRLAGENSAHVHMLANLDADLPAITVHWPTMRVIDGMHRLRAAILRGEETIEVRFASCDEADIFVAAVAANIRHGLPLSLADRESAAARIVQTHPQWSNRRIAAETGLSHKTVAVIRSRATGDTPQLHGREGRDGRVRPLHTTDRRLAAADFMARNPAASLRQVAKAIGLSAGTVRDVRTRLARGEDPAARHVQPGRAAAELRRRGAAAAVTDEGGPRSPGADVTAILHSLSKDPAIRLTDTGREVFRLLRTCAMCAEKLDTLTADIPPHRIASVADLAKANARFWMNLAAQLDHDSADWTAGHQEGALLPSLSNARRGQLMDDQVSRRPFRRLFEVPFAQRDPIIVGDTSSVEHWAVDNGYKFCDVKSAATLTDADLFVVCATNECYKRLNALREAFASCRVLWMPFAAFHDETGPIDYGLSQIANADLGYARDKQIAAAGFLSDCRAVRVRDASGNSAVFRVPRSAFIQEAPREQLKPGDFISVISYFEVETEYAAPGCDPVAADGTLAIRCLLFARAASSHSGPDAVATSSQLCAKVASAQNCRLELADGFLSRFIIDDQDVASSIGVMAGERLGRRITEFSIGLNDHLPSPDWSLNSPLNEGAAGVHLGVGDGYSGIHFDFICPFATVEAV